MLKSWFLPKRLRYVILFFWLLTLLVSGLLLMINSLQTAGVKEYLNSSPIAVYLFLMFLGAILKMLLLFSGKSDRKKLWFLLAAEAVSLNLFTCLPLYFLARQTDGTQKLSLQEKAC